MDSANVNRAVNSLRIRVKSETMDLEFLLRDLCCLTQMVRGVHGEWCLFH